MKKKTTHNAPAGVASDLKKKDRDRRKRERFLAIRMWTSTLLSKFFTDRGSIPDNIGNNILIANNVYITKNHLCALIHVAEMSEGTPVAWMSDIMDFVKRQCDGVLIDVIIKNEPYYVNTQQGGMASRIQTWHATIDNPLMPKDTVRRAARCLYSVDILKSNTKTYKGRTYIRVMAKDNRTLTRGCNCVMDYLTRIDALAKRINNNIEEHMAYVLMMSNKRPEHLKDIPAVIYSTQTLAESLPSTQGYNNTTGQLVGYDAISHYPYHIDFRKTANAKNIMIEAMSGFGKTYLVEWWLHPFYADGFCQCIMDLKGTEFTTYTQKVGGVILSLRSTSTNYINSFVWNKDDIYDEDPVSYAARCIRVSKEKMCIISEMSGKDLAMCEALIEEFLETLYMSVGAVKNNTATWKRTSGLTPYVVYDKFVSYLSNEIIAKYGDVAKDLRARLSIYMSRNGSNSHTFRDALRQKDFLDTRCLTFDFGIIEGESEQDPVTFKLHVLDMVSMNNAYVTHNKHRGLWTLKVLEESQIAADYLLKIYKDEVTLRRAQNQITVLLGNSVTALMSNPLSKPILENMNILVLGKLNRSSRQLLINEFDLSDVHEAYLEDIQVNPELMHTFLLVNRMEKRATTALLQTLAPDTVTNSSTFKVVDTVE